MPDVSDSDAILSQFNLLMQELLQGEIRRGKFQPWEIDIILDIESSGLRGSAKRELLREYQNAVQVELEKGETLPLKFSEFCERREVSQAQRKPSGRASRASVKAPGFG